MRIGTEDKGKGYESEGAMLRGQGKMDKSQETKETGQGAGEKGRGQMVRVKGIWYRGQGAGDKRDMK